MARMDRHKKKKKKRIMATITLLIPFLTFAYTVTKDIYLSKENIKILFDSVYLDEIVEFKKSEKFYVPGEGLKEGILIPVNCKINVVNKSSKPTTITMINAFMESDDKDSLQVMSTEIDSFVNYISVDGKKIENRAGNLTEPIIVDAFDAKVVVFNVNYLLPENVINIFESNMEDFYAVGEDCNGNEEKINVPKNYPLHKIKMESKDMEQYLANKNYSIWGEMEETEFIYNNKNITSYQIPEEQLPYLRITCKTVNGNFFNKKDRFSMATL